MSWYWVVVIFVGLLAVFTAVENGALARCPYCGKIGAWRFDALGESIEELDEDGYVVKSTQRQSCWRCGGAVDHVWSDPDGREIRKVELTMGTGDGEPASAPATALRDADRAEEGE